jgi:hypothetical protein
MQSIRAWLVQIAASTMSRVSPATKAKATPADNGAGMGAPAQGSM